MKYFIAGPCSIESEAQINETALAVKKAGANIQIKKKVVIDLDLVDKYIKENCEGEEEDNV